MKIIEREGFYVRSKHLKPDQRDKLIEAFTYRFYNEKACNSCEYKIERHSDICDNCNAFSGTAQLASPVIVNDRKYIRLPAGSKPKVIKQLAKFKLPEPKFVNKQVTPEDAPFKTKVRFKTKLLKDYQGPAIHAMVSRKKGVLKSAPRTGKTVMFTSAVVRIKGKTIILAAQRTWLEGFYETFCGSKTQKRFTDGTGAGVTSKEISAWRKAGRPYRTIGFAKTLEDFKNLDVCLVTYQTFLSDSGQKLLKKVAGSFAVLGVDEVHTGNAEGFAHIIAAFRTSYKLGLSGTPQRKDRREIIVEHLFGPIIHETKVKQLQPRIAITKTQFSYSAKSPRWDQMVASIENNPKRLKLIAETAVKDARDGHMVLIPMWRVKSIKALTMAINRIAGKNIAAEFHGGISKDQRIKTIQAARDYKLRIMVGSLKMLSTGINIPRASMLYEVSMSSNMPNAEQRFKRILTPFDGKPPPVIRYFLDDMTTRRNCLSAEYWGCLVPTCKPIVSTKQREIMASYFRGKDKFGKIDL